MWREYDAMQREYLEIVRARNWKGSVWKADNISIISMNSLLANAKQLSHRMELIMKQLLREPWKYECSSASKITENIQIISKRIFTNRIYVFIQISFFKKNSAVQIELKSNQWWFYHIRPVEIEKYLFVHFFLALSTQTNLFLSIVYWINAYNEFVIFTWSKYAVHFSK